MFLGSLVSDSVRAWSAVDLNVSKLIELQASV
jgi:hypothetical protein